MTTKYDILILICFLFILPIIAFVVGRHFPTMRVKLDCSHIENLLKEYRYDDCLRSYINTDGGRCEGTICDMDYNFLNKPTK